MIEVNKYQTQITDELLNSLPLEIKEELIDVLNNIEFIKRLISPNRKYAKDLERKDGRIIVDILNPHILENMDYFRPTGNHFRKYGVLTKLRPNGNPNSEFGRWLKEELNRFWNGMVRESDGEWITGDMYFYLNYSPIIQSKVREGTKQADRIVDFPEVWEGVYLMFHYIDQARNGGIYNNWEGGQHCVEIAKRGASKSYLVASILAKQFIVGENEIACKNTRGVVTAYQKESLTKDGTLNKFIDIIDFCAENTQFPSQRLKDSLADMTWTMGYKDGETNINKGTSNTVLGVSAKDNVEKSRGKRANKFIYEEFGAFPKFIDIWNVNLPSVQEGDIVFGQAVAIGCVCAGTKVWTNNGSLINIEDLKQEDGILGFNFNLNDVSKESITYIQSPSFKECVRITLDDGRILECSNDHPIAISNTKFKEAINLVKGDVVLIVQNDFDKKYNFNEDCWYEQRFINKIEKIGKKQVYNLTANITNTYIANGIITHNTGGSEGSNFYGALEIIYNPLGYNVYALPNVFDKNSQGQKNTVFFFGTYLNRKGMYNKDGVSDVIGALLQVLNNRYKLKYNSTDPLALTRNKAENPITIQEAIMKKDNVFYPTSDILEHISEIDKDSRSLDYIGIGNLELDKSNVVTFKPNSNNTVIRSFPHKDNKLIGSCEIHKPPVRSSNGKVQRGRYIAGIDTYDDDVSETLSLGSIYILDLLTDDIVFEYTGRPSFADDFYEICRRALLFYNAEANYENNKKGLFAYFSKMNCTYLLSDVLDFLKDKEMIKGTLIGNKSKGTISTAPIKAYGRKIQRDWLLKPVTITIEENNELSDVLIPKLKQIKSRAYLQELSQWNPDGNFDRHDAMLMLMLLREDKLRMFGENTASSVLNSRESNYLGNDSFFSRNYDKKMIKYREPLH